jgi:hypothetical protein
MRTFIAGCVVTGSWLVASPALALEFWERREVDQEIELGWGSVDEVRLLDAGDLNADGYDDVVASYGSVVRIYHGGAKGLTLWQELSQSPGAPGAGGDLNADGYDDVVLRAGDGQASACPGGPDGLRLDACWPLEQAGVSAGQLRLIPGDLNADGYDDIVSTGGDGALWVWLGGAEGPSWAMEQRFDWREGDQLLVAGDVNADGRADVLVVRDDKAWTILGASVGLQAVGSGFSLGDDLWTPEDPAVAAGGDHDGDGRPELIATDVDLLTARIYTSSGLQYSAVGSTILAGNAVKFGVCASSGDLNADGYAELVVGAPGGQGVPGQLHVYLGGAGGVGAHGVAVLRGEPGARLGEGCAVLGDVNGDGYRDLAGLDEAGTLNLWHGGAWLGGAR